MGSLHTQRILMLFNYKTIHLELSSKCVLKCPRCPRTELDLDRLNQEVSLDEFKSGFPIEILSEIENFIFCGDIGDPIYATEFLEVIEYIKSNSSSRVRIVTNGSYKKSDWWQKLGSLLDHNDRVTFSVDGWDDSSNNLYRVNSDFDSIVNGIKALRGSSDCSILWSTIYFSFNQHRIGSIRELAKSLGCNQFQTVKSSKFDGRYGIIDELKPATNLVSSSLIYETQVETLNQDKYVPIVPAVPKIAHPWARCLNYTKDLFIGVDGLVTPCPWFNNGYQHNDFVHKYKDRICIKTKSLKHILQDEIWNELLSRFDMDPLEICRIKCKDAKQ